MIEIYFVRHAQSTHNVHLTTIGGQSNHLEITKKGEKQAALFGQRLKKANIQFDRICCSTAVRTTRTLQIACEVGGISKERIEYFDDILELSQGGWEGELRTKIYTPETIAEINKDNWNFKAPNGESQRDVEERMVAWTKREILDKYPENAKILVCSHGLAIKCFLRYVIEYHPRMNHRINFENTGVSKFSYYPRWKSWAVNMISDVGHLYEMEEGF